MSRTNFLGYEQKHTFIFPH